MFSIITLLLPAITGILSKIIPDANARAQAQEEITRALIEKQGEVDKAIAEAAKAQAEVNLAEAQNPSMFVSGWRPFLGWVCGIGFTYSFVLSPILNAILSFFGVHPIPVLDTGPLMTLVLGMLGLGTMRTAEKIQGVDRQNMGKALR